ncbi:hypothetical protein RSJ22_14265 [Clostridium botulinum]|nr:hypothetical protein RSJ22_14265 [Clostridium botulinum]MBN3411218.1 hypothetical protein [Clostridium botulinum]MBN3418592.1 hypothetical protein [Clostridium botulinum]MBN3426102.1 hypothetical protein [Clostridium botulinum]QDY19423.1 hypothetical protein CGQ27_14665 [Clostridium botulinum]
MVKNAKREEELREKKLKHLVRFLKSNKLSLISDNIATVDKKNIIETETDIIVTGNAVVGGLEEFIEGYSLNISKEGFLDWKEDWFAGAINLHYINSDKQLMLDGARYV